MGEVGGMKFKLEIDLSKTDAKTFSMEIEVLGSLLRMTAERVENGEDSGSIWLHDDHCVGEWEIEGTADLSGRRS